MSKLSVRSEQLFREVFKNQFGYYPKSKTKLLKDSDVNDENLSKLQLMGYIPYVVEVLEKFKKPCWRDVVRYRGKTTPPSSHTLGTMYRKIGFIDYDGRTMIKGKNFDKFLTTKWDWFDFGNSMVFVKGEKYSVKLLQSWDRVNSRVKDYVSQIPSNIDKKIFDIEYQWSRNKSNNQKVFEDLRNQYQKVVSTEVIYQ